MIADAVRKLQKQVRSLQRNKVTRRYGTVTDIDPLSVVLGGSEEPYVGVKAVGGAQLAVGDHVAVDIQGMDLMVLGGIGAGDGSGGGGPYQPLDPELTALSKAKTVVAAAIGTATSLDDLLSNIGGAKASDFDGALIGRIEFYGDSRFDEGLYGSSAEFSMTSRLAAMLRADIADYSISGAMAAWCELGGGGDGGIGTVFRHTEAGFGTPAVPRRGPTFVGYGPNDLGWEGPTAFDDDSPYMRAMEAIVSRLRASVIWEVEDGSPWALTGSWSDQAQGTPGQLYDMSGGAIKTTTSTSAHGDLTIPAPIHTGATIAVSFRTGSDGRGALWDVYVDRQDGAGFVLDGQHETRNKQPTVYGGGSPPVAASPALSVYRLKGINPGDVIKVQPHTIATNAQLDCAWAEAESPTPVSLVKFWQPPNSDMSWMSGVGYPYEGTDGDWQAMNDAQDRIAALFSPTIPVIDLSAAIDPTADVYGDIIHLNERGHADATEALFDGVMASDLDRSDQARNNVAGAGVRTRPRTSSLRGRLQNVIEQVFPAEPAVTYRQAKRTTTPFLFEDFPDDVAPLVQCLSRDGTQALKMGSFGGSEHGTATIGFFTEGLGPFDALFADFADAVDDKPVYAMTGGGLQHWAPDGSSDPDVSLGRHAVGQLAATGLVVNAGGAATKKAPVGGSLFDHFADAGSAGTAEADLYSDTIPASVFSTNGDKVEAFYAGYLAGHATNTRTTRLYLAGTKIFDSGAIATGDAFDRYWQIRLEVVRSDTGKLRYAVEWMCVFGVTHLNAAAPGPPQTGSSIGHQKGELTGLTLSNTQILKVAALSSDNVASKVVAQQGRVRWFPAAI